MNRLYHRTDYEVRHFALDECVAEITETDSVTTLCNLTGAHYGFALANNSFGVYNNRKRLWKSRSRFQIVTMTSYSISSDGSRQLIIGFSNGLMEARSEATGEVCATETFAVGVAGIVKADLRGDGKEALVIVLSDGSVKGYVPAEMELVNTLSSGSLEEDTLRELNLQKQQLLRDLKNFESTGGAKPATVPVPQPAREEKPPEKQRGKRVSKKEKALAYPSEEDQDKERANHEERASSDDLERLKRPTSSRTKPVVVADRFPSVKTHSEGTVPGGSGPVETVMFDSKEDEDASATSRAKSAEKRHTSKVHLPSLTPRKSEPGISPTVPSARGGDDPPVRCSISAKYDPQNLTKSGCYLHIDTTLPDTRIQLINLRAEKVFEEDVAMYGVESR
ncbi:Bardet-Biedl syndrome 2 protein [Borealophlyctis nickersoniae]|nr:Bardet-Biedl syndrome 2 protein [Borealophlyctis nickersoniae]